MLHSTCTDVVPSSQVVFVQSSRRVIHMHLCGGGHHPQLTMRICSCTPSRPESAGTGQRAFGRGPQLDSSSDLAESRPITYRASGRFSGLSSMMLSLLRACKPVATILFCFTCTRWRGRHPSGGEGLLQGPSGGALDLINGPVLGLYLDRF